MNFPSKSEVSGPILIGFAGVVLFFSYNLFPIAVLLFGAGVLAMLFSLLRAVAHVYTWRTHDMLLALGLTVFALSHAVGVFIPEVGFDALWYHLPITQVFLQLRGDVYIPELYQSAMPHLGSLIYAVPFFAAREFGVKLFCYILTLLLPLFVYRVGRNYLPKTLSLLCALLFFAFHTVGWQASSAYVDQLRTVFELAALHIVLSQHARRSSMLRVIVGVLLGFALSVKLASLFFLPAFIAFFFLRFGTKKSWGMVLVALLLASPWYIRAFLWTGNPVFPLFQTSIGTAQLMEMGMSSWATWWMYGAMKLAVLPLYLTAHKESFTTLLYAFAFPFFLLSAKKVVYRFRTLLAFTVVGFVCWFLIPPLSVRYALTFFACGLYIAVYAVWQHASSRIWIRRILYGVIATSLCISLALRVGSHLQAAEVLTGKLSEQAYISKQTDGITRGPSEKWYSGYWKTWQPPQDKTRP